MRFSENGLFQLSCELRLDDLARFEEVCSHFIENVGWVNHSPLDLDLNSLIDPLSRKGSVGRLRQCLSKIAGHYNPLVR